MAQKGLSKNDIESLSEKLTTLRVCLLDDTKTIENQQKELTVKQNALVEITKNLQTLREDLVNDGKSPEPEFGKTISKYLQGVRNEVEDLRQHRSARTLSKKPLHVMISGAAGHVGYALASLFATGQVLGLDQPLVLKLLEIPSVFNSLKGMAMEIEDGVYPLVEAVIPTIDPAVAFKDVDYAILVGGFPRAAGMERKDLLAKNAPIFQAMGEGLQIYAKSTCKVLVVANPANTNCLTCSTYATKIPKCNFAALTRLDQNRASAQVASKLGVPVRSVSNVVVWGNHSNTQVPDVSNAVVTINGKKASPELDEKWVMRVFIPCIQQRGKAVMELRGFSSAASAANAIKDCIHDWHFGTPIGEYVSLAVYSDGSHYGVAKDIFYSFPITCKDGTYSVVSDLKINDDIRSLMKKSEEELLIERHEANLDK